MAHKYVALDTALAVLSFSLFGVLRPDYVIIASFFLIIIYLFLTKRLMLVYHLFLAMAFAAVWVVFARDIYVYNQKFLDFMGVSLYPMGSRTFCGICYLYATSLYKGAVGICAPFYSLFNLLFCALDYR